MDFDDLDELSEYEHLSCVLEPENYKGGIFLGDLASALELNNLKNRNILAILTVSEDFVFFDQRDFTHLQIKLKDTIKTPICTIFDSTNQFIKENLEKSNVLVHCFQGISRSATVVIAYLMEKNNWKYEEAFEFVKKKRKIISPNSGFISQLINYEKKNSLM